MEISSNSSQCEGNGVCGTFALPLDGKYIVQTVEDLWGNDLGRV
jgi:hypothetical protein